MRIPKYISRFYVTLILIVGVGRLIPTSFSQKCESVSFGNTFVHASGEINVFGTHTFSEGSMGVLPGIVGTERVGDYGLFSFSDVSDGWEQADDDSYVDGYVKYYGDDGFVFPIGDNGTYRPIAISKGPGTRAAYYGVDPDEATTDDLFGGLYPVLPAGGPFPTDQLEGGLYQVSQVEYWDIDGSEPTKITLTWDMFSEVSRITENDVNRLTIIAFDGSNWIPLPSKIDLLYLNENQSSPRFNAGISSRTRGSITTVEEIIPDTYLAYTFGAIASGFIGDYVWEDLNRNGVQEDGEPGLAGVQVSLHTVDGALLETIITNESGKFAFDGVPPGRYYLSYVPPVSYLVTLPGQGVAALNSDVGFDRKTPVFTLGTNDIEFGIDAGFYRTGTVGDYVWLDANGDGIQNDGEVGVPNVRIQLLDANGELLASTVSDQTGFYNFTNIPPGDYIISFTMPEGYGYAPYKATLDIELDSDIDPLLGTTEVIALKSSEIRMNVDIGLSQECDYVASFDVLAPECGTTNGSISISINGDTGPYSFNWANGESTQVLSGLDTGLYEVVVTDTNGCNRALSIRVDYEQECELQCVNLDVQVFLEGPYDPSKGEMNTDLNELGYLPGQRPLAFFGIFTDPGQPYSRSPYSYFGVEGVDDEAITTANNNDYYPETTVDWVLVSLRVAQDEEYETCTRAGLLQKDGTIIFDDDSCCQVDPTKQYYVVIEHRNHLIIMSPTVLPVVNNTIKYDFRTNPSYQRLFGFSQKSMGDGVLAMYASNGDQYLSSESPVDINVSDLSEWLKENGDNSSYYFMDFDLNGDANVQDKGLYLDNIGVFTDVPKTRQ